MAGSQRPWQKLGKVMKSEMTELKVGRERKYNVISVC